MIPMYFFSLNQKKNFKKFHQKMPKLPYTLKIIMDIMGLHTPYLIMRFSKLSTQTFLKIDERLITYFYNSDIISETLIKNCCDISSPTIKSNKNADMKNTRLNFFSIFLQNLKANSFLTICLRMKNQS